mgnify:CR=1 FL=1
MKRKWESIRRWIVFQNIKKVLLEKDVWHEIKSHEPVYTSEQAARARKVALRTGVKAMVLKGNTYFLVLIRADKKVDFKLIKKLEMSNRVRLASPEEVKEQTGCETGSVPPFGFARDFKTYLDKEILKEGKVNFNAGLHTKSIVMMGKDLLKVVEPVVF